MFQVVAERHTVPQFGNIRIPELREPAIVRGRDPSRPPVLVTLATGTNMSARQWSDGDLGQRAELDGAPAPLFPLEHLGRLYRVELVPGSASGSPQAGVSVWRVKRGRTEVLVTPWRPEEPAIALRARLAELLA